MPQKIDSALKDDHLRGSDAGGRTRLWHAAPCPRREPSAARAQIHQSSHLTDSSPAKCGNVAICNLFNFNSILFHILFCKSASWARAAKKGGEMKKSKKFPSRHAFPAQCLPPAGRREAFLQSPPLGLRSPSCPQYHSLAISSLKGLFVCFKWNHSILKSQWRTWEGGGFR